MLNELEIAAQFLSARLDAMIADTDAESIATGAYAYPAPASAIYPFYTWQFQQAGSRITRGNGGITVVYSPLFLVTFHSRDAETSLAASHLEASRCVRYLSTTPDGEDEAADIVEAEDTTQYAVQCVREMGRPAFEMRDIENGVLYNRVGGAFRLLIFKSSTN